MDRPADHYLRMCHAVFACSQTAWARQDYVAHDKAAKLHRKFSHLWEQAKAREKRARRGR